MEVGSLTHCFDGRWSYLVRVSVCGTCVEHRVTVLHVVRPPQAAPVARLYWCLCTWVFECVSAERLNLLIWEQTLEYALAHCL